MSVLRGVLSPLHGEARGSFAGQSHRFGQWRGLEGLNDSAARLARLVRRAQVDSKEFEPWLLLALPGVYVWCIDTDSVR